MSLTPTFRPYVRRQVNPRLGVYFAIFASAFAGLTMLLVILEQLGYPDRWVRLAMIAAPAAFAAVIGIGAFSRAPEDYFASGRRVPAFFNGLIAAVTALGATGLLGVTGTFYLYGMDGLCLALGYFSGFILAAVLLVPFLRKLGAYTLPSYLGRRFSSRTIRMTAAALLALPVLLILIAEIRVGATLVKSLLNVKRGSLIWPAAIAICITVAPGGMRSLTWSNAAWALIALIALIVPVSILSVMLTNLPLPQITYGGLLPQLAELEAKQGLAARTAAWVAFDLPDFGASAMARPFANAFGAFGPGGFLLAMLTVMLGTAAMPTLLARSGTTPGVFEARKSMAWATLILGVILLTLPAIAVFSRLLVLTDVVGKTPDRLPEWMLALAVSGQAQIDLQSPRVALETLMLRRDIILLAMPSLANLPSALIYISASGIVAAALAGASARLVVLANMLSEDLVYGRRPEPPETGPRLAIARISLAVVGALAAWIALQWAVDPLRLVFWALSLAASVGLPVLVMSIWWKRINPLGALAGMLTGFTVSALCIITDAVLGGFDWLGVDSTLAATFGVPAGALAAVVVSLATAVPGREVRSLVRDIRVPGGETIHDREIRLNRRRDAGEQLADLAAAPRDREPGRAGRA